MTHTIEVGPHPNIVIIRLIGDLTSKDIAIDPQIGLDAGHAVYLLVDASQMNTSLPENFLSSARASAFVHPNLAHTAVFIRSALIKNIFSMIAKLTRQRDKLSMYDSYDQALEHLQTLVKNAHL